MTRRGLLLSGAAGLAIAQDSKKTITAGEAIDRIKANVGVPWRLQTVDNVIAGAVDTPVRGIATTMMATLDVLQRSAAAGKNLVITHEPTFYSHQDTVTELTNNATYKFKLDFIAKNQMVVFHFHDHWHARRPDGIAFGMMRDLGWEKNADPQNQRQFTFPGVALGQLTKEIESRLKIRMMRVLGDPKMPVNRVASSWGYLSQMPGINVLSQPGIDALICGETREWEVVEFAQDMISSGQKKALIVLGHVVSEQAGMKYCAEWLRTFLPEVTVDFVPAEEPFWRPS